MKDWVVKAIIATLAVFAPAKGMVIATLALIFVDLITGLMAAKNRKSKITSAGIRRTVSKIVVYEVAILMAYIAQTYLTGEAIPVSNIVAGLIGMTELVSIMENMNAVSGKNLLKAVIDKLGSVNK